MLNLIILLITGTTNLTLLFVASHTGSLYVMLLCIVFFSLLNLTIFSLLHEATHGVLFPNPNLNYILGLLAALFFPTSFTLQKVSHLGHHERNRTRVERFDMYEPGENRTLKFLQWYGILTGMYYFLSPLMCIVLLIFPKILSWKILRGTVISRQTSAEAMMAPLHGAVLTNIRMETLFTISIWVIIFSIFDLKFHIVFYCFLLFGLLWSSIQYLTHAFSPLDIRNGAWNLRFPVIFQMILLNYNLHLAHHRNPSLVWYHLGKVIDPQECRPSILQIYARMWKGPIPIHSATEVYSKLIG